jgi:type IV pilus biogenesis protein CpaD/CtpE
MARLAALAMVLAAVLAACAAPPVANRPCPRVTEFPPELQRQAADELTTYPVPALARMMEAMAADRAFNRAVCP